ncbi:unnamed protein product [Linum tenue]|uniref:RNase H type-1 domain-containing protein n=1 Tax=Linum tenue TaxID=586396 RepID=A0AAV0I7C1_9ROSI|nr:unnamed protein product [Linum tenue]
MIFQNKHQDTATLACRIRNWTRTIEEVQSKDKLIHSNHRDKQAEDLSWIPPPQHWVAVNTDGSVKQPHSQAASGGIIRDHLGRCLGGFYANLGACTITRAELKGALQGLQLAWRLASGRFS